MRYRLLLLLVLMTYSQDIAAPDLSRHTDLIDSHVCFWDLLNDCLTFLDKLVSFIIHYYIEIIRYFLNGVEIFIDLLITLHPTKLFDDLSSDCMMYYYRVARIVMENTSRFIKENEYIWFMFFITTNTFQHEYGIVSRRLVTNRVTIIPIKRHAKFLILCLLPVCCLSVEVTADPIMELDLQFLFTIFKCPGSSVVRLCPNNTRLNIVRV